MIFLPKNTKNLIGCPFRKEKIKIALNIVRTNKKIPLLLYSDNLLGKKSVKKKKQLIEMFVMKNLSRSSVTSYKQLSFNVFWK